MIPAKSYPSIPDDPAIADAFDWYTRRDKVWSSYRAWRIETCERLGITGDELDELMEDDE